jgi:hypothetical protein
MSENKESFFVYGAPITHLIDRWRYRMYQRELILALPKGHTAQVINLSEWRAAKEARPN